jgi:hypothetical protein
VLKSEAKGIVKGGIKAMEMTLRLVEKEEEDNIAVEEENVTMKEG